MNLTSRALNTSIAVGLLATSGLVFAQKGETIKVGFIDPLSGPFANVGQNQLKSWQFVGEHFNAKNPAGVKFEFVAFDNKGSPQDSLTALKAATDQGIRYIVQGNGSGAAAALVDAVAKHNARNPGKEVLYLNYAAVDPALTNEKCDYWHFRLDADTTMKMEALTSYMKDQAEIKKVYIIGQNYSHGKQVSKYFKEYMARKRPDVQIVGDDLHPIGQVKDFAPYVAKIKASGADAVLTGNWGQDLTLLVKAAKDAGMNAKLYTYYAGVSGTPTALGTDTAGKVRVVAYSHSNMPGALAKLQDDFKAKFNDDFYTHATYNGLVLLTEAMAKVKSSDPVRVAAAMEDMTVQGFNGEIKMRKSDHQLQQAMFISSWEKVSAKNKYNVENTGMTFVEVKAIPSYISSTPTSCAMKRP